MSLDRPSGVVDEHVHAPEGFVHDAEATIDIGLDPDITEDRNAAPAERLDGAAGAVKTCVGDVEQGYVRAGVRHIAGVRIYEEMVV